LQYLFRILPCTIGRIVVEVCQAIYDNLKEKHLKVCINMYYYYFFLLNIFLINFDLNLKCLTLFFITYYHLLHYFHCFMKL